MFSRLKAGTPPPAGTSPSRLFVVVLGLISFVGPLSLHLFFPAVPAVKADFGVSDELAQLSVSAPMFAMAFLTLVYGSLSDRLGRRGVLLVGLLLFALGSLIAAFSPTIWTLLAGRLIQAAGGACGLALSRAIARDVYGADRLVRVIAYLTMAYAMAPMVSPPIAGFLVDSSGWRSVLVFATVAGVVIAGLAYTTVYETHRDRRPASTRHSYLTDYVRLFRDVRFTSFVVQSGACSGAFFATATGAAFLMSEYLGRSATEYGLYFPVIPIGYLLGNFVASRLSGRVAIETMVLAGSLLITLTAGGLAVVVFQGHVTPVSIFAVGFMVTFSQGIGLPNAQAGALRVAGDLAGTASGIGVFMQLFAAGFFSQMFGFLADGTPVPLVIVVSLAAGLALIAGIIPFVLDRRHVRPPP